MVNDDPSLYSRFVQSDLLHRLSHTTGSLVDDDGLIEMLANTKATAREADEKLAIASKTEEQITQARYVIRLFVMPCRSSSCRLWCCGRSLFPSSWLWCLQRHYW